MDDLLENWRSLAAAAADPDDVERTGRDLLQRWSEPHRKYHTVKHLRAVLRHLEQIGAYAANPDVCALAAWFHDAVYEGRAGEDERASAALARVVLARLDVPASVVAEVVRLVELTATHSPSPGDTNGAVLCDADLAILGSAPTDYAAYAAAVRAEYATIGDADFRAGRATVLRRLIERDPLFLTATARELWESTARSNLSAELAGLDVAA